MTIEQAKENILKNWRANYTADHMDNHDKEVFLLNAMEQLEAVVKHEYEKKINLSLEKSQERIKKVLEDYKVTKEPLCEQNVLIKAIEARLNQNHD